MEYRRQVHIGLWAVVFLLQFSLVGLLIVGLTKQSRNEEAQLRPFQPSKAYAKLIVEKGGLSNDEQQRLVALCADLEKMVDGHGKFEASILNEVRGFYTQLLLFLGIAIVLQLAIVILTFSMPATRAGAAQR